jgi:hypothetical protein
MILFPFVSGFQCEQVSSSSPIVWMEYPRGADLHFLETRARREFVVNEQCDIYSRIEEGQLRRLSAFYLC